MSELIFIFHSISLFVFLIFALKFGKEALLVLIVIQVLLANFFVQKETVLFGLKVTCSDAFTIGSLLGLNLLREYFGKESSKLAVRLSFLTLIFFGLMCKIHLLYPPSLHDKTQGFFKALFDSSPRLLFASILSYLIAQKIDLVLVSFFQKRFPFFLRCSLALLISQLIDTTLFSFIGLYGIVSSLSEIILFSYLIKVLAILILTPFIAFLKKRIQP